MHIDSASIFISDSVGISSNVLTDHGSCKASIAWFHQVERKESHGTQTHSWKAPNDTSK